MVGYGGHGSGATGAGPGVAGHGGYTNGIGVTGDGHGSGSGVSGQGGNNNGAGVVGQGGGAGIGVWGTGGSGGTGVRGTATAASAAGVLAENTATGGTALQVAGKAVFSRSGLVTVAAGSSTTTVAGVALTSASLVLATLQQHTTGVYVLAAVPSVSGSSFTVYLSKAVTAATKVAWVIIN